MDVRPRPAASMCVLQSFPFRQFGESASGPVNLAHPGIHDPTDSDLIALRRAINSTDLPISKTSVPATVRVNEDFMYRIEVSSNGPNPASLVQVVDILPSNLTYVSDTAGCVESPGGTLTCELGEVLAQESRRIEITVGTVCSEIRTLRRR